MGVYLLLILHRNGIKQMFWISKYSLLSVQRMVKQPEGLFASPNILLPPGEFCRVKLMGPEKHRSLVSGSSLVGCELWINPSQVYPEAQAPLETLWDAKGKDLLGFLGKLLCPVCCVQSERQMLGYSSCDAILVLGLLLWV